MIKQIMINLVAVARNKASIGDKMSMFLTSNRLLLKSKFENKNYTEIKDKIYNYTVYSYNYSNLEFLFKEVFVANEYLFTSSSSSPVIIDCGANIGMSILYFKKLYPDARIQAFEANPSVCKILTKNVQENNLKNVEVHNVALYDKETDISFFTNTDLGSVVGSIHKQRGGGTEIKMRTRKLSDYLKQYDSIDLIKIDVEGAETAIVDDLVESGSISKAKEYVVEYHHNIVGQPSQLSTFLKKFESSGFSYNIQSHYEKSNPFQDIILHFYKS